MTKFLPEFEAVNCSASPDKSQASEFNFAVKPDVAIYQASAPKKGLMDVSCVDIIVEFKYETGDDPFRCIEDNAEDFAATQAASNTLGQLTCYASAHLGAQWCTCVYSVFIVKDIARILRWDRTGMVVTGPITYNSDPALADFFWRYAHSDPAQRGMDETITIPTSAEVQEATALLGPLIRPVKLSVGQGDQLRYFITSSPSAKPYAPHGRATRGFAAYDILRKIRVFLKDSWHILLPGIQPEGEIYQFLHKHHVRNIAPCSCWGDVAQNQTVTYRFARAIWNKLAKLSTYLVPHRHHRTVLDIFARPITMFSSTRQLVPIFLDAVICKSASFCFISAHQSLFQLTMTLPLQECCIMTSVLGISLSRTKEKVYSLIGIYRNISTAIAM